MLQVVPKYKELSLKEVWRHILDVNGLKIYFSDYKEGELPERDFKFVVVCTVYSKSLRKQIETLRKKRSIKSNEENDDAIEICEEIKQKIMSIVGLKVSF